MRNNQSTPTAYDFSFKELTSQRPLRLEQFTGKVILIVNTASRCGFTAQYKALEELFNLYKDQGLVVIGVPSNNFGKQELNTDQEIEHFCQINYGVSFPMTTKENVSGKNAHPFYQWAKKVFWCGASPKWNFHKYLIDRKGNLIDYFYSTTSPNNAHLKKAIVMALQDTL